MTEEEKYEALEDDLIRLNFHFSRVKFWGRLFRKPTPELKNSVEEIGKSIGVVSAHLEFCKVGDKEKLIKLLRKAENQFFRTLKKYKSLNRWNYTLEYVHEEAHDEERRNTDVQDAGEPRQ